MKLSNTKRIALTAACMALCVVLPITFHSLPGGGSIFLPMHLPVLLCGILCSWPYGLVCGLLGPALSSLITGAPPAAYLPSMMLECGVYGCISGLMITLLRTRRPLADLLLSLVIAMIAGRLVAGIARALIFAPGTPVFAWIGATIVEGLPGIAAQLVLIPLLVLSLTRAKLLPKRYDNE